MPSCQNLSRVPVQYLEIGWLGAPLAPYQWLGFVSEPRILPSRITPDCRLLAVADRWRGPWAPGNPSPKGLKESPLGGRDGGGHHEGAAEAQLLTIARNFLKDVPAA